MNRTGFSPRVTGMFSVGGIHLVPSFGIQEMYYGEAQAPYHEPLSRWWAPTSCAARAIFRST